MISKEMSILDGVGEIIDKWLPLTKRYGAPPHYRHRSTFLSVVRAGPTQIDGFGLAKAIYGQICTNWSRCPRKARSLENWRWAPRPNHSPRNRSPEVTLERAIVQEAGVEWANQVPAASGLCGSRRDRRCCVDLVHKPPSSQSYEFIELKWNSNHPLYAAMEVLCYGMLYLFADLAEKCVLTFQQDPANCWKPRRSILWF